MMNRPEELTLKLIDGVISDREFDELDRLLKDDPEAQEVHAALFDLEAALRSRREDFNVAAQTMERVRQVVAAQPSSTPVDERIGAFPTPTIPGDARGRRTRRVLAALSIAVCVLIAVGAGVYYLLPDRMLQTPVEAVLAQASEGVTLSRRGRQIEVTGDVNLQAGDVVVAKDAAVATVRYADETSITLRQNATVEVLAGSGTTKRLSLQHGEMMACVTRQVDAPSLEVSTPSVRITVLGTRFLLAATKSESRLDVIQGRVRMERNEGGESVDVVQGQFVVAAPDKPLVAKPLPARVTTHQIALYRFDEGQGTTVHDVSDFGEPLHLEAGEADGIHWSDGGGLLVEGGAMLASKGPATKIFHACKATGELTVEAWIVPAEERQGGPARIVTFSRDAFNCNFTLGQGYQAQSSGTTPSGSGCFILRMRTTETDENGEPSVRTPLGTSVTDLTHLAYTRSRDGKVCLYIDGVLRTSEARVGDFSNWDRRFRLALGNEFTEDRTWEGRYHLVAIYQRALDADQVLRNFLAGL